MDIQRLVETYGPSSDTFIVELPKGEKLEFRTIKNYAEYHALRKEAETFRLMVQGHKGAAHKDFKPYKDMDDETLRMCSLIHHCLISVSDAPTAEVPEPEKTKWSQKDILFIAANACFIIELVSLNLQLKQNKFIEDGFNSSLDDAGND